MRVIISGATGFIGQALCRELCGDYEVVALTRDGRRSAAVVRECAKIVEWDARTTSGWARLPPDRATEDDLRRYLLFIKNDQQWKANSLKVAYSGLKFFYTHTCPRKWATLIKIRVPKHRPTNNFHFSHQ